MRSLMRRGEAGVCGDGFGFGEEMILARIACIMTKFLEFWDQH